MTDYKKNLPENVYKIAFEHATESKFSSPLNEEKGNGIYKCYVCGQELFHSDHKFESGTGWPSFFEPINKDNIGTQVDNKFFMKRTEVHCSNCNAHLGHWFPDGAKKSRYCINGAVLKFNKNLENK